MNFEVKRNLQFTRLIKAEGRLREFNFTRLTGLMEGVFNMDVVDDRGNRIIFQMKQNGSDWTVLEPALPNWITTNINLLQEAIETELSKEQQILLQSEVGKNHA